MNDDRNESDPVEPALSLAGSYQEETVRRGYKPVAAPRGGAHGGVSGWASMLYRIKAVLGLKRGAFNELAADPASTKQALLVIAAASAIGSWYTLVLLLLAVPLKCIGTAIAAGICCLVARVFSRQVQPYANWFRAFGFAAAPMAAGAVPIVGTIVGWIYVAVLQVVATRELSRTSTPVAVITWVVAVLVPATALFVVLIVLVGAVAAVLGLGEFLGWRS